MTRERQVSAALARDAGASCVPPSPSPTLPKAPPTPASTPAPNTVPPERPLRVWGPAVGGTWLGTAPPRTRLCFPLPQFPHAEQPPPTPWPDTRQLPVLDRRTGTSQAPGGDPQGAGGTPLCPCVGLGKLRQGAGCGRRQTGHCRMCGDRAPCVGWGHPTGAGGFHGAPGDQCGGVTPLVVAQHPDVPHGTVADPERAHPGTTQHPWVPLARRHPPQVLPPQHAAAPHGHMEG